MCSICLFYEILCSFFLYAFHEIDAYSVFLLSVSGKQSMGILSNRVRRQDLEDGDHIYSWRAYYTYAHHGKIFNVYFSDVFCSSCVSILLSVINVLSKSLQFCLHPALQSQNAINHSFCDVCAFTLL